MSQALLAFDVDRIKEYVFATGRLREIRGGSDLVRRASDQEALSDLKVTEEEIVYADGGSGLLLLADEARARQVAGQLERHYQEVTRSGTLTTACVDCPEEDFQGAAARVAAKLRQRKAGRPVGGYAPAGGALAFCGSCRQEPPAHRDPEDRNDDTLLCDTCYEKRLASREFRKARNKRPFWPFFTQGMGEQTRQAWEDQAPKDFAAIGACSRAPGYLAICYADGDGMGSLLGQMQSPEQYGALSRAIGESVAEALGTALRKVYAGDPDPWRSPASYRSGSDKAYPFEVIAVGGDDVLVVCTADGGLPLALEYCRAFHESLQERIAADGELRACLAHKPAPSSSAGVLVAHDTMPVVTLRDRVGELLRSAKRARRQRNAQGGLIDFHFVSTPALGALGPLRKEQYTQGDVSLLARPYTLEDLAHLLGHARVVGDIPASKRAALYEALFQPQVPAVLDLLRIQTRLRREEHRALFAAAQALGWLQYYPYGERPGGEQRLFTGLVDLLEVADMLAPAMGGAT